MTFLRKYVAKQQDNLPGTADVPPIADTNSKFEPVDILNLRNIKQVYNAGKPNEMSIFDGSLSFDVKDVRARGQFVTILGESGCGKTTILKYISGLQKPTSGEILIQGKPQTEKDRAGMVFQTYGCFPWLKVIDYVMLPLKIKGVPGKQATERAMEIIAATGLEKHKDKYAQYGILSGGQLQRVAIAASLVANDKILLMDEPFGALDNKTRGDMQDRLLSIWNRIEPTILLVTHDITEAVYLSDQIVIMQANPGKIVKTIEVNVDKADQRAKRGTEFTKLVYEIEDIMDGLNK